MEPTLANAKSISIQGGWARHGAGERVRVGGEPILVGRNPSCAIVIADPSVSAVHVEIGATTHGIRVRDLGSKNGTWLAGARVEGATFVERGTIELGRAAIEIEPESTEETPLSPRDRFGKLFGANVEMRRLFADLARVAKTDLSVLIDGETGVGKEVVAATLHAESARAKGPFVVVDCGAIAPQLAESLLFGHERGAFTGAIEKTQSPFLDADGGTVFLDEIGELPLDVQPKLLRALAERRVQAVGGRSYVPFDARVVSATRRDLGHAVNAGAFRSDLYFRIAQFRVRVPALRDRLDDVPGLVTFFAEALGVKNAKRRIVPADLERLVRYDWPGNVRELKNLVTVAVALAEKTGPIDFAGHMDGAMNGLGAPRSPGGAPLPYHDAKKEALARFEKGYFAMMLAASGGSIIEISRRAGLQRTHVRRYLREHGLVTPRANAKKSP